VKGAKRLLSRASNTHVDRRARTATALFVCRRKR
jgi:hypothetical protein